MDGSDSDADRSSQNGGLQMKTLRAFTGGRKSKRLT